MLSAGKVDEVVRSLAEQTEPPASVRGLQVWSHPAFLAVVVVLLGAFWVARKAAGLV